MSQTREATGRWYSVCFCSKCHQRLSRRALATPTGRCPHCGADSQHPLPDYYVVKHRMVTTYRKVLGLFWIPVSTRLESQDH